MHSSSSAFASLVLALAITGALAACGGGVESTGTGDGTATTPSSSTDGTSGSSGTSGSTSGGVAKPPPGNGPGSAPPESTTCNYPVITNPPACPPAYTRQPLPSCLAIGLKCWYPGAGDGDANGCWSTALLQCVGDRDVDAGDVTTGHWVGSQ